ncbi:MAG: hypothetical protein ACLRIO_10400 [Butyricicoccus sp.]
MDDTPVKVNGSVKLKVVNKGTGSSPITITKNQMVLTKSDGANVPSWVDFEVGEEVTLSIASNDSSWSDAVRSRRQAADGQQYDHDRRHRRRLDPQSTQCSRCEGGRHGCSV